MYYVVSVVCSCGRRRRLHSVNQFCSATCLPLRARAPCPHSPGGDPFLVNGHLNSGARGWPDPYNQRINVKLYVCKRARCHSTLQTCYAPRFGARTQFLCNQNPLADFGVERVEWGPPCCPGSCMCFCTLLVIYTC